MFPNAHPFCLVLQLCSSSVSNDVFYIDVFIPAKLFIHRSIVLVQVSFVFVHIHLSVSSAEGLEVYLI